MNAFRKLRTPIRSDLAKYFWAVAVSVVGALTRILLNPLLRDKAPFASATIAVILCAVFLDLGPALLCLAVSMVLSIWLFVSPEHVFVLELDSIFSIISFAVVAGVVSFLAHRLKVARDDAHTAAVEVKRLNSDLEERVKQRTAELEEANAELAGFTYSIAHDMRQYLRGINVAAHTIVEDQKLRLDEDGKDSLVSLARNARLASSLVDGLLEFSRLGRNEIKRASVSFSSLAHEVATRVARLNWETTVHFEVQQGLTASCDGRLLEIALQNLIENAAKYRAFGTEPHIEVGAIEEDGVVCYYVKDDGIGFEMKFIDHIFLPFERLHRQTEYPGTGIGLATVKRIVEKHGGRIWAESNIGQGSTFFFTLAPTPQRLPSQRAA